MGLSVVICGGGVGGASRDGVDTTGDEGERSVEEIEGLSKSAVGDAISFSDGAQAASGMSIKRMDSHTEIFIYTSPPPSPSSSFILLS